MFCFIPSTVYIYLTDSTGNSIIRSGGTPGRYEGEKLIGNVNMGQLEKRKWKLFVSLQYHTIDLFISVLTSVPTDFSKSVLYTELTAG